uniref:Uncharacterized protein LOC113797228 n=1 Tax=Dermatophagoides pteronyssinus TaxID=6956 RepID=A0A6P6YDL4_DERPT
MQDIKNLYNKIKNAQNNQTVTRNQEGDEIVVPEIKNVQLYKQIKQQIVKNFDKYVINNEKKERTRKVYSEEVQHDVLDMINKVVKDPIYEEKIITIKDYNNTIYTCQKTYMEVTERSGKESTWREAINKKIEDLKEDFKILEKYAPTEKPTKEVKTICSKNRVHSNNSEKVIQLKDQIYERIEKHQKRLRIAENRKVFRKNNRNFEFNRKRFYRSLGDEQLKISESINNYETLEFWQNIWAKEDSEENCEELIDALPTNNLNIETTNEKVKEVVEKIIKYLPAWKTPGHDCVHNFFIKKITALHGKLIEIITEAVNDPEKIDPEMYIGTTYLIPKKENASHPKELRPITCLPNIYKLLSKVIQTMISELCDLNDTISSNQMGTRRRCQGAKQQALVNKNLNISNDNGLKTSWIDIQKAYDSVGHQYLEQYDIKLLAKDEQDLQELCFYTKSCLKQMGFQVNEQKSASNIDSEQAFGEEIDNEKGYKYLGVLEDSRNVFKEENKKLIEEKIIERTEKLCQTKLNAKNLMHAINEYAISTINYYVGLLNYEMYEFDGIDQKIRNILQKHGVIRNASNIDRLYLARDELGRGLCNISEKAEIMMM